MDVFQCRRRCCPARRFACWSTDRRPSRDCEKRLLNFHRVVGAAGFFDRKRSQNSGVVEVCHLSGELRWRRGRAGIARGKDSRNRRNRRSAWGSDPDWCRNTCLLPPTPRTPPLFAVCPLTMKVIRERCRRYAMTKRIVRNLSLPDLRDAKLAHASRHLAGSYDDDGQAVRAWRVCIGR